MLHRWRSMPEKKRTAVRNSPRPSGRHRHQTKAGPAGSRLEKASERNYFQTSRADRRAIRQLARHRRRIAPLAPVSSRERCCVRWALARQEDLAQSGSENLGGEVGHHTGRTALPLSPGKALLDYRDQILVLHPLSPDSEHTSQWEAIRSIAEKIIGCSPGMELWEFSEGISRKRFPVSVLAIPCSWAAGNDLSDPRNLERFCVANDSIVAKYAVISLFFPDKQGNG